MDNPQWRVFYAIEAEVLMVECDTPELSVFLENDNGRIFHIERNR